jgi:hypothetical protein
MQTNDFGHIQLCQLCIGIGSLRNTTATVILAIYNSANFPRELLGVTTTRPGWVLQMCTDMQ